MSEGGLRVFEDPGHPQGGHALILFEDVTVQPHDARFRVDALEEGAQAWPEHLQQPVLVTVTERGLEIVAGPEIGNAVLEGTPVSVAVPAAGLQGEILWPGITPLALGRAGRGGVHAAARRRVAIPEAQTGRPLAAELPAKLQPMPPDAPQSSAQEASPPARDEPKPPEQAAAKPSAPEPTTPPPKPAAAALSEARTEGRLASEDAKPRPEAARAPAGRRIALVAAAAFLAGVGSVLAYAAAGGPWPFKHTESQPEPKPVAAAPAPPPSLYDALVLPPASPRGLRADGKTDAFAQVRAAWGSGARPQDGSEAAYWLRAIAQDSLPDNLAKSFSALGFLSLQGDGIARDPALAMLFFELAAIGGRCDAFAALADGIEPPDKWRAIRWHGIAEQKKCPEPGKH